MDRTFICKTPTFFVAIIGIGPSFVMTFIAVQSKTLTDVKHAYYLRKKIHLFIMTGGTVLLLTGLMMGGINPVLFKQAWYVISLCLYVFTLLAGPLLLSPSLKPIKRLLEESEGEELPAEYEKYAKRLFFFERVTNLIILAIITLMITKPS